MNTPTTRQIPYPGGMRASKPVIAVAVISVLICLALVGTLVYRGAGLVMSVMGGSQVEQARADEVAAKSAEDFYRQKIHWGSCASSQVATGSARPADLRSYECATLYAPLDWDDPSGEQITLALGVHRSGKADAPILFFNLGGPGGAAVSALSRQVEDNLGTALVDHYDLLALDPRGVGASTPVKCLSDEQLDLYNAEGAILGKKAASGQTPEEIVAQAQAENAAVAAGCQKMSGELFGHIDTISAAKDFDMVRAVLGLDTIDYLGYSYGTFLGATYAELFPERVGRMVLDGAIDPAATVDEVYDMQMRGFEDSINHWIDSCLDSSACPLSGSHEQARSQLVDFLDSLDESPLETSDPERPLTRNLATTAIIGMLYSESTYAMITQALIPAIESRDGSQLLFVSDILSDRGDDGSYSSNGTEALMAVNNLDYGPAGTIEEWAKNADLIRSELPVFGDLAGYASAGLDKWPTSHAQRGPIAARGSAPIVVIGTTHDPATPYAMAKRLAQQLDSGILVTNEGWGHTAYDREANSCITGAVEDFFIGGVLPEDGLICR